MAFNLFSKNKNENQAEEEKSEKKVNIQEMTSSSASKIIKQLSGGQIDFGNRMIDNFVVVSNASGGAGASTVVSNVAYTASRKGLRVLVIDLNILLPTQHMYFGIKQELEKPDLVGYLLGKNALGDAMEQTKNGYVMYANNRGLMDYINCELDQAVNNLKDLVQNVKKLFDFVIVDCPMSIENTICNYAFYMADAIYLVWDEGISSIANTEKIRRNMAYTGIDAYTKMKIILNKRTDIQYSQYPFKKLNVELMQFLPFEQAIITSSLASEIFCEKGQSRSKNAGYFVGGIEQLTDKILEAGGYIK